MASLALIPFAQGKSFSSASRSLLKASKFTLSERKRIEGQQKQFLDVIIVRTGSSQLFDPLPDGLGELRPHNLITYKSLREPLSAWALHELVGYYVNYRKQTGTSRLLPEDQFGLYAVATRSPRKLKAQLALVSRMPGVYDVDIGGLTVRVIVLKEIQPIERNALWNLFSARTNLVQLGARRYRNRTQEMRSIMNNLIRYYNQGDATMPYTMEDYREELKQQVLKELTPEELLSQLTSEERLKGLPVEERLKGLPAEELLKGLTPRERTALHQLLNDQSQRS